MQRRSAVKQLVTGLGGALVWPRAPLAAQRDHVPRIRGVTPMHTARAAHTATPLADGRVLVAGGFTAEEGRVAGCEIFAPGAAAWTALPGGARRHSHSATPLSGGRVLLAGGYGAGGEVRADCEIFDAGTGAFSPAGMLTVPRAGHEAVLLRDGRVLVIGGVSTNWTFLASAEIVDPARGRAVATGAMAVPRESHAAVALEAGRVLVIAGHHGRGAGVVILASMELYDVAAGRFTPFGTLTARRHKHDAVRLDEGRVLVTGGADERDDRGVYDTTEIVDPTSGRSRPGPALGRGRYKHRGTTIVLDRTRVLLAGGGDQVEILDVARGSHLTLTAPDPLAGQFSAAARIAGGQVLVTGGYGGGRGPRAAAWLIDA